MGISSVEEDVIASEHHEDIEQDGCCGKAVELDACRAETFKEARSHLQTDHEHEEHEAEVLNECQDVGGCREPDVTCHDTCEKHEGNAQ